MVGHQSGDAEQLAKPEPESLVDPRLAVLERLLQESQALVEDLTPRAAITNRVQGL